jgi:hypothetical protein
MSTKYIVDNLSGQTINGDLTINGNFEITGTTNTRPYKVFTALLTQSGGDNLVSQPTGDLLVGSTYAINYNSLGMDFTNVGAPNNEVGTYFIAIGTTPNSWGSNEGDEDILTYNTGAPVVTVLENTIGNIWFSYDDVGNYYLNSDGLFTDGKTYYSITLNSGAIGGTLSNFIIISFGSGQMKILTLDDLQAWNDFLINTPIEIRVYN